MPIDYVIIQKVIAAVLVGYLLGSIPFALIAARLRGVDIFSTGSQMAGTANVFWNVGRRTGTLVFIGDVAKGSAAVIIAQMLDVSSLLVLSAGGAAIFGHWKSLFAGFRGGDGMASLMGVTLAVIPSMALLGIATGFAVILVTRRSIWRSSWGIAACFTVLIGLSLYYKVDQEMVLGLTGLAGFVLVRSTIARRRRIDLPGEEEILLDLELDIDLDADSDADLGSAAPENR
ncbi:MAG: glycerol-3-phosphate acyltransferase [Dehalococcoidia bacterium]